MDKKSVENAVRDQMKRPSYDTLLSVCETKIAADKIQLTLEYTFSLTNSEKDNAKAE